MVVINELKKPKKDNEIILQDREEKIMQSLIDFYSNNEYIEIIKPIIEGRDISLRVLDWFVTNYSKEFSVNYPLTYTVNMSKNKYTVIKKDFEVWTQYKSQLKLYSKDMFDPFCRLENEENESKSKKKKSKKSICKKLIRFTYNTGKNNFIETTIGQLNFFRWVITNKILDYIKQHQIDIETNMNESQKELKSKKQSKKLKKLKKSINIKETQQRIQKEKPSEIKSQTQSETKDTPQTIQKEKMSQTNKETPLQTKKETKKENPLQTNKEIKKGKTLQTNKETKKGKTLQTKKEIKKEKTLQTNKEIKKEMRGMKDIKKMIRSKLNKKRSSLEFDKTKNPIGVKVKSQLMTINAFDVSNESESRIICAFG